MTELRVWWPVRGVTIALLAGSVVHAFIGNWRVPCAALVWLVLVLFISLTRASNQ